MRIVIDAKCNMCMGAKHFRHGSEGDPVVMITNFTMGGTPYFFVCEKHVPEMKKSWPNVKYSPVERAQDAFDAFE